MCQIPGHRWAQLHRFYRRARQHYHRVSTSLFHVDPDITADPITSFKTADQRITSPGRIARALGVFCVDEIVVYDDSPLESRPRAVDHDRYTGDTDPCHFIVHVLSYLETPPFMRKSLFPLHDNLAKAGLLPSLDMPHHPHKDEWLEYREGVTVKGRPESGKGYVPGPF